MMTENGKVNGCRSEDERQVFMFKMLECHQSLRAFAISLSGNADRADDLVQDTYLRAIANRSSFTPGTNMAAWLFTILRNSLYSEYRKRKWEAGWDEGFADDLKVSTGFENGAEAALDLNRLLMFVTSLPPDQRDALIAIGYLRLSYEQTAEALSCALGTVKSRVNRARDSLAAMLKDGTVVSKADLSGLKRATAGVPKSHPYYPIALAYEELYAELDDVGDTSPQEQTKREQLWEQLVASGALDHGAGNDFDSIS